MITYKDDELILDDKTANNLIEKEESDLIFLDDTPNLYSTLVRKSDFSNKRNYLQKLAYVGGKELHRNIQNILNSLSADQKEKRLMKLRKAFLNYCGIENLSYGKLWYLGKLIKKWTKQREYPFPLLRVIGLNDEKQFIKLVKKIEYVTTFCHTTPIYVNDIRNFENKKLWYLIGSIMGDGCLIKARKDYRVVISDGSTHKHELKDSYKNVVNLFDLFSQIFRIPKNKLKVEDNKGWYNLIISNKNLTRIINFFFGVPYGKKKGKLFVPKILDFLKNKEIYEKYLWRGIFDSDAMVSPLGKNIEFASSDLPFVKECQQFLKKLKIPVEIKEGFSGKKGYPYYWINIKWNYIKEFALKVGNSHPRKQRILVNHLQKTAKDNILRGINKNNILSNGNFNLDLMTKKDKRIQLPIKPSEELLQTAEWITPRDWQKARIFFRTKYMNDGIKLKDVLDKFENVFGIKPKFLSSRNLYYVNSRALYEFFNKFFIYDAPWGIITKEKGNNLIKEWNSIFEYDKGLQA